MSRTAQLRPSRSATRQTLHLTADRDAETCAQLATLRDDFRPQGRVHAKCRVQTLRHITAQALQLCRSESLVHRRGSGCKVKGSPRNIKAISDLVPRRSTASIVCWYSFFSLSLITTAIYSLSHGFEALRKIAHYFCMQPATPT